MPDYSYIAQPVVAQPVSAYMQGRAMRMAYEQDKLRNDFLRQQMEEAPKQAEFERRMKMAEFALEQRKAQQDDMRERATALRDQMASIETAPDPVYAAMMLSGGMGVDLGIRPGTEPDEVRARAGSFAKRIEIMAGLAPVERKYGEVTRKEDDQFVTYRTTDGVAGDVIATAPRYKPAGNTVNLPGAQTKYEQKVDEYYGKTFGALQDTGREAINTIATADRLEHLMKAGMKGGPITKAMIMPMAGFAQNLGIDIDTLGPTQAYQAITRELALRIRNPESGFGMPGAISRFDLEYLSSITPDIANSDEGRRLIIDRLRKLGKHQQNVAAFARKYAKEHGRLDSGFDDALAKWANANPIFVEEGATRTSKSGRKQVYRGGQWQDVP